MVGGSGSEDIRLSIDGASSMEAKSPKTLFLVLLGEAQEAFEYSANIANSWYVVRWSGVKNVAPRSMDPTDFIVKSFWA